MAAAPKAEAEASGRREGLKEGEAKGEEDSLCRLPMRMLGEGRRAVRVVAAAAAAGAEEEEALKEEAIAASASEGEETPSAGVATAGAAELTKCPGGERRFALDVLRRGDRPAGTVHPVADTKSESATELNGEELRERSVPPIGEAQLRRPLSPRPVSRARHLVGSEVAAAAGELEATARGSG